jgi:hypothetical protein
MPCPRDRLEEFEPDPEWDPILCLSIFLSLLIYSFISKLRDGRVSVDDEDWPSFLYEDGIYDLGAIDEGYFLCVSV